MSDDSNSKRVSDHSKPNDNSNGNSNDKEESKDEEEEKVNPEPTTRSSKFISLLFLGTHRGHKRANYSKEVTNILNNWLESHLHYPYPIEDERIEL